MGVANVFKYIGLSLIPVVLASLLYYLFKRIEKRVKKGDKIYPSFLTDKKKFYWFKNIIAGIIFGIAGIISFYLGIEVKDYLNNTDTLTVGVTSFFPIISGFNFGSVAGTITTLIIFIFRICMPDFLRWATVVAIVIGGLVSVLCCQLLFREGRCRKWYFAALGSLFVETVNIICIFLFNLKHVTPAYNTLRQFDMVCILCHTFAGALTCIVITIIDKRKIISHSFREKHLGSRLQIWLFSICLIFLFVSVSTTYTVVFADAVGTYSDISFNSLFDLTDDFDLMLDENSYKNAPNRHLVSESGFCLILIRSNDESENYKICAIPDVLKKKIGTKYDNKIFRFDDNQTLASRKMSVVERKRSYNTMHFSYGDVDGSEYMVSYCEVTNHAGGATYYAVILIPTQEIVVSAAISSRLVFFIDIFIFIALFALVDFFVYKKIVNNVEEMDLSLEKIMDGQLDTEVKLKGGYKEFETLSNNMNLTIGTLKNYGEEIERRMEDELTLAKSIQNSAVPTIFPVEKNYNIYAMMKTAKDVGGDFYDYYKMNNGLVMFLIADVSGKGIPGALFMMRAKTIIKSLSATSSSIEDIVNRTNKELLSENEMGLFVTAWIGILNPKSGELTYVNAGHNPPLLKRANGKYEEFKNNHNLVLAGMDDYEFKSESITLSKGDEILLYTDGVTEAINLKNEQYGLDRLINFVNTSKYFNAKQLLENISDDVFKFSSGMVEQFDDTTMLMLRYDGVDDVQPDNVLTIKAYPKNASIAINFVESILSNNELDPKLIAKMSIVVDEIFANVAYHAYEHTKTGDFVIQVDIKDGILKFVFIDSGVEFDSTKATDPDVKESIETRKRGGLGLFIVRNSVDSMTYRRDDIYNVLTIEKKVK